MQIITEQENPQIQTLNEMIVKVGDSLPKEVEQSIYYPKLKHLLHGEIINFCKEQVEMKQDLNLFRMNVGSIMSEQEIREYLDGLREKYKHYENLALDYHIEVTRFDYGVVVFCIIKRNYIFTKKFVFRFRKKSVGVSMDGFTSGGIPISKEE